LSVPDSAAARTSLDETSEQGSDHGAHES
jgi:hypothetical protein